MRKKIILCLICFIFSTATVYPFNSLDEIEKYAAQNPEYPTIDNQNYLKPDFKSFYEKNIPSQLGIFFNKTLNFLGIKRGYWTPTQFALQLEQVTKEQEKNWGVGDYIIKVTPKAKTEFVIWGDIQGAFHSLTRTLAKLKNENYLNKDLKIINPNCFFIFDGNVLGRSAYIMETFTTILSLMAKNPKQVIYIKGEEESNGNWQNYGLEQQLKYKAAKISKENIPLESEIVKFLKTLPLAFYIKLPSEKSSKFIRISYFDRTYPTLNEFSFSDFLQKNDDPEIEVLNLTDKKPSSAKQQFSIEAIIEGKDRTLQYQKTDGLQLLLPDKGSTAWSILSCPTLSSQKVYNFFNDAFAILTVDPKEKTNLITLYKQNALDKTGFAKKTFNIISEELVKEEAVKAEKATTMGEKIVIGSSLDLYGVSYISIRQIYEGLNLFFKKLNSSGGINGKEINYIVLNDQYQPELTVKNINTLLDTYKTNIVLVIGGTPTTKAVLPQVKAKEILVAFPYTGANIFRKPELTNFIHMKTSYEKEAFALTDYAVNQMKLNKFAILYQDDDFGLDCLKGVKDALEKNGIKNWCQASYPAGSDDIEQAAQKITFFDPQAIMLFAREKPATTMIEKARAGKIFLTASHMSDEFTNNQKKKGVKIILSSTVPNPNGTDLEILKEYQNTLQANTGKEISINTASLTGYIYAAVFTELLKRIDGDITKEKIIEQAEKIKNENFKGLSLNFDPQTRELFKEIWINTLDDQWIKSVETKTTQIPAPAQAEKQQINIAANLDLSSVLALNTKPTLNSLLSTFQAENQINKKYNIKLTYFDNKLKPDLIKEYTEQILKSDFKFLIHTTGSIILEQMLPLLKDKPIFIFNGATSQIFYKPELKNLINSFPSSYKSSEILTEYIIKNLDGKKKFAIVYQQDPFSESAAQASKDVLIKYNLKKDVEWIEISHKIENIDDVKITDSIKKFNPDVIIISSLAAALKALVQQLGITFLYDKVIATIEATSETKEFLKSLKIKNISTLLVPDPNKSSLKIVQDYKESFGKKQSYYSERELEGYMTASLLTYLFNKIDSEITPEKVLQAAEKIKNENFKGLALNFDPKTRCISDNVWIDAGDDNPFLYQKEEIEKPATIPALAQTIPVTAGTAPNQVPAAVISPQPAQAPAISQLPAPTPISSTEKQEITIGATQDLSDVLSYLSKPALTGMLLRFQEENQSSKKYKFKLVSYDNKFKSELGVEQTQKMLNDGIKIFIHSSGSKILEKMLPLFTNKSVAVQTGAASPIFQNPELKKIYIDCPSSFRSAKAIAEYLVAKMNKENKKKKFAIIYQEESNRISAAQGFESVLKENNLKENVDWIAISHKPENIDAAEMAEPIKKFNPDILFIASLEAAIQSLINRLDVSYLFDKTIAIIEATPPIKDFIRSRKIKLISAQLNPDASTSKLELVQNYRNFLKKTNPDAAYNDVEFLGYMEASMMIYLINKIDGPVTPEKILTQVENCKHEAFSKDLYLNFDPQRRTIFDAVWLDMGEGEPFLYQEEKKETQAPAAAPAQPALAPAPTTVTAPTQVPVVAPAVAPQPATPKVAQNEINVGVTLDQNGKADETIKATAIGLKLRIAKENSAGGINGKKINLIIRDDEFNPNKAKENIEKFLSEDKTDIILSPVGSYPFTEILPFIKDKKIGVFFPDATSPEYQKEEYKNLINLYASSYQETKILFNYIITQLKLKKLAIFCEDEPFSQGGLAGAKEVLEKNNLKENVNWKLFPQNIQEKQGTISSSAFSEGIQNFDPDGIVIISLQSNTQALMLDLPKDFLSNKKIFGISTMVKVKKLLQDRGMKVVSTQIVPDPINSNYEIVKEYRKDITEKSLPIHSGSLEGYIAASIFIDLLKKVEGENTKEKIIEQAEKIQNYDFKGLPLNFNPKTRNIFGCVFLDTGDTEQIMCKAEQEAPVTLEKKEVKAIAQNMTRKKTCLFRKDSN